MTTGPEWQQRFYDERSARHEDALRALDRYFTAELAHRDHALALQAAEVERRLKDLNHETARVNDIAASTVSTDVYAANREADRLLFGGISKRLDESHGGSAGRRDVVALAFAATGFVGVVVGLVLAFVH